jgi:cardiolipin synthase A/B
VQENRHDQGFEMRFYNSSTDAWLAMSKACKDAKTSIDFEEYIIRDDSVGSELLAIFMTKARSGVRVRLLLDAFGSRKLRKRSTIADLDEAGVQVVFFRPINFLQLAIPSLGLPRDHAKALHIDGTVSYLGSMCVAAHMIGWRDTLLALNGYAAKRSQLDFNRVWACEALNLEYRPCVDNHRDCPVTDTYAAQIPELGINGIIDMLLTKVADAQHKILIASPYFYPPRKLRLALVDARLRGVSVTLMLASKTDIPLADIVTRGLVSDWRRLGFDVLFYQPQVLHAKYALIDDQWATVGSCNFDLLGLRYNREANIVLRDPSHVREFVSQCARDLANCLPSPATNASPNVWEKAVGKFGALVCRCF